MPDVADSSEVWGLPKYSLLDGWYDARKNEWCFWMY